MSTYSTPTAIGLGNSDLTGSEVSFVQLPNGDLFALNGYAYTNQYISGAAIEILELVSGSLVNVTSSFSSGALVSGLVNGGPDELYVGSNTLPDIVLPNFGLDQTGGDGGQVNVIAPQSDGVYQNVTSALPQQLANNQSAATGEIDGQAAFAVAMVGNTADEPEGIELVIADADGGFTNWTSHLPADVTSIGPGAGTFNCVAIADFADSNGDIFLGAGPGIADNILVVNNGSGGFIQDEIDVAKPVFANGSASIPEFILPAVFQGDTHEDVIIAYENTNAANTSGNNYYLQFLKGNGSGGFTDVTSQYLPDQPLLIDGFGNHAFVTQLQIVDINGRDDLIAYEANGSPEIFLQNSDGTYAASPVQVPQNDGVSTATSLVAAAWGTDAGVGGFFGFTNSNQWVFDPITAAYLDPTSPVLNQPLANRLYLYGDGSGAATATTLDQTFDTTITLAASIFYTPGQTASVDMTVNGVDLGSQSFYEIKGPVDGDQTYTTTQTLTFTLPGLSTISSLVTSASQNGLYLDELQVDGVDISTQNTPLGPGLNSFDAAAWNRAVDTTMGTAADPIQVTETGSGVIAYVLGDPGDYTVSGVGTSTIKLSESKGLDQNAVLTGVAYIGFQDGSILNTQTGVVTGPDQSLVVYPGQSSGGVQDQGVLLVQNGGVISDAVVTGAGNMAVYGSALRTIVSSGSTSGMAVLEIDSGGYASGTLAVGDFGYLGFASAYDHVDVVVEGLSLDDTVLSGADEFVSAGGEASGAYVGADSLLAVYSGAVAVRTGDDGALSVYSGGVALGTVVGSDGWLTLSELASGSGAEIENGGTEVVDGGAVDSGGTVVSGGMVNIESGASAVGFEDQGDIYVYSGGVVSGTKVGAAGVLSADADARAVGTVISSGGMEVVASGAVDSAGTVLSDGFLLIESGGSAVGTTLLADAELELVGVIATSVGVGGSAGILDLMSGGVVIATLGPTPQGANLSAVIGYDGGGDTYVTEVPAGTPARDDFLNDGVSQVLIENTAGAVVLGQVASGALSYTEIGGLGLEWRFVGTGDFLGDGETGFLIENTAGAVDVGEVVGGQARYTAVGGLGPEWSFVGTGDFLGDGKTAFLIENTAGAIDVGEVVGGQTEYTQVAALGPEWSFVGTGDFLGDGKTDFLIENTVGAVDLGEVVGGQTQYNQVAALGPEWSFVESGDFLGDGKTDFLIENAAGAVAVGEMSNGQAIYTTVGGLGPEWHFVGAGDYSGTGIDSFLIENTAGAVFTGTVASGQAQYAQVGGLGSEWRFHG